MKKLLKDWTGDMTGITPGHVYDVDNYYFKDDNGTVRNESLASWSEVYVDNATEEHTGGSSSYYDLTIGPTTIKCLDIIEGLGMSYNEGNVFKAVWRIAAAKQGRTKKGNNMHYDAEKIVFFGERLVEEHINGEEV